MTNGVERPQWSAYDLLAIIPRRHESRFSVKSCADANQKRGKEKDLEIIKNVNEQLTANFQPGTPKLKVEEDPKP